MSESRRLGRYELLDVLGHGAMGVVYKAHDSFLDRIVAVKTYRQEVPITEDVKRRFEREVRTASKLNHPNIVVVYDGGLEQSVPYLAMEFVEGPTLADELARHDRLPLDRALYIVRKIADGLAYAHARGVVHRDLKPANILLAGGMEPKIADFGVAKLMSSASATALTAAVGTPSYMAPEQIEGHGVDARSDVFALGILAYELVTGRQPFVGEGWTAVMFQIMNVEPEPPTAIDASLPAAVDGVLARSLAKNPNDRTPDVVTFAKELAEALTPRAPVEHREVLKNPEDSLDAGAFEGIRDLAPPPRERSGRQRSSLGPVSAVVVLLVGVLAVVFHLRSAERDAALLSQAEAPIAMATSAPPTEAPAPAPTAVPTAAPTERPPTPVPTARPTERPTAPPRAERTVERPKPTAPAVVARPTIAVAARVEPTPVIVPPPRAKNPTIDVISEPPGAEVLVDGSVKGRTPLRISDLDPGSYRFEVRKEGRSSYRQTAELEADADYTMKVSLPIMVNSLRVLSQPDGVDVKLNGVSKGRTPLTLSQLPDGHYEVTGELDGFEPQTLGVNLKDGELQEVRFTFGAKGPESR
jgi:tRNA A-37 threonylcarbamoyl transferase component Bud32